MTKPQPAARQPEIAAVALKSQEIGLNLTPEQARQLIDAFLAERDRINTENDSFIAGVRVPQETVEEIRDLMLKRQIHSAVRLLRTATGFGLREAHDWLMNPKNLSPQA